ncbi:hypothetical protein AVEN_78111-1 [Araneus ventricosus]|uniref:Uncharacterized protein n=1 Tax=Araneus ventricosus TaxID=182803 RepID=A0A4Y2F622_ARAVE|nr:hypothetical protein AVEN_78111-1 [Araneus ventricosus]
MGLVYVKSDVGRNVFPLVWKGMCQSKCRLHHLTAVENYEVCPKIVLEPAVPYNPLIPKTIGIEGPQNTGRSSSSLKDKGTLSPPSKTNDTVRILRKSSFSSTHLGEPRV